MQSLTEAKRILANVIELHFTVNDDILKLAPIKLLEAGGAFSVLVTIVYGSPCWRKCTLNF